MTSFTLTPILSAANVELYRILFIALLAIGGTVIKKISEARERAERNKSAANSAARNAMTRNESTRNESTRNESARNESARNDAPRNEAPRTVAPPPRPPVAKTPETRRDNQFRNEIEVFLEEVGRRRSPSEGGSSRTEPRRGPAGQPAPRPAPRQTPRPQTARSTPPAGAAPKAEATQPLVRSGPLRPGDEIASRKAPVSDDLGAQIRSHLSQYLESSRLSQADRADLGKAVERAVREHMGTTVTRGASDADQQSSAVSSSSVISMLRNPTGVQTAILVNEILARPRALRRKI